MTDQPVPIEGRRPFGVLVVAVIQFVRAVLLVGQMAGFEPFPNVNWLHISAQIPEPPPGTVEFVLSRVIGIGLVAATVLSGLGILAGRRWGWIAAIVLCGVSLAFGIGGWWDGKPTYLAMAINTIAVFYLNQRDVRAVFDDPAASSAEVRP
jgi:hypothetical protein